MPRLDTPAGFLRSLLDSQPEVPEDCIIWPFTLVMGYARISQHGQTRSVTHLVLEAAGFPRPEPPANFALHSCPTGDNRACVNHAHLRWGTAQENMDDRSQRGRSVGAAGERNGRSRLTAVQVQAIRERALTGENQRVIAEEFGVGRAIVSRIKTGRRWGSLSA